jgi:hypothetical protein
LVVVVGVEESGHDGEIGSQGDDRSDVQVPIRPSIDPKKRYKA